MRRTVSRLFWETACILRLQWDPNKDPKINSGYKIDPSETSQSGTAQIFSECDTESQTPILIYSSLEILTARIGEIKVGKIGPGPGLKKIRRQVAETNAAMENILMDTIRRLYARAVTLADAAAREEENQGRKEFLTDLIDSINEKTARLLLMRERVQRKMKKMNIECYVSNTTTG